MGEMAQAVADGRAFVELEDGTFLIPHCSCQGQVRRIKSMQQYIFNGYPGGVPLCTLTEYECAECGRRMDRRGER